MAMRRLHLRGLPALLVVVTLAVEVIAVALSWGLEPRYNTLYAFYSVALAGASRIDEHAVPPSRSPVG